MTFDWISESWELFKSNALTWVVSTLIMVVISYAIGFVLGTVFGVSVGITTTLASSSASSSSPFGTALAPIVALAAMPLYWAQVAIVAAINAFFYSGMVRMANAQVRGQAIDIGMLFQGGSNFLSFLVVMFIISFIFGIGFTLCVIPGLIAYALMFPALALAADGESIGSSLSRSIEGMKSNWLMAGIFIFAMFLLVLVSMIPCFTGLLVTIPMVFICMSLAYRDILGMPGAANLADPGFAAYGQSQPGSWPPPPGQQPPNPYQQNPYSQQPQNPYPSQQGQNPYQQTPPPAAQPGQTATPYMPYVSGQQPQQAPPVVPAPETYAPAPEPQQPEQPADDTSMFTPPSVPDQGDTPGGTSV